jgi:hypothetical protein
VLLAARRSHPNLKTKLGILHPLKSSRREAKLGDLGVLHPLGELKRRT